MAQGYSFYGGKAGFTYKIVARYDAIYISPADAPAFDPTVTYNYRDIITYSGSFYVCENPDGVTGDFSESDWQEIKGMVNCFMQGGSYMEANYGEYVIIDTILNMHNKSDPTNGIIYRRGMNFLEEPATPIPRDEYMKNGILQEDEFRTAMHNWVIRPGGDAEYIGQICGPQGETPKVEVLTELEMFATPEYLNADEGGYAHAVSQPYAGDNKGILGDYEKEATTGKPESPEDVYHNTITAYYVTVRDENDNITGVRLAFTFPYHVYEVHSESISPYADFDKSENTKFFISQKNRQTYLDYGGTSYEETIIDDDKLNRFLVDKENPTTGGYKNLVTKVAGADDSHPYWSEWDIKVPQGREGDSTEEVWVDRNQELHLVTRNYDFTVDGMTVDGDGHKTDIHNLTDHRMKYHAYFVDDTTSRDKQALEDNPVRLKVIDYTTQGKATDGATASGGRNGMEGHSGYETKKDNTRSFDTSKKLSGVDEDSTLTYLPYKETKYQTTWYTTPDKTATGYNDDPSLNTATNHVYEEDTSVVREIDCIRIENSISEAGYKKADGNIKDEYVKTAKLVCYYSDAPSTGVAIGELSAIKKLWRGTTERSGVLKDHLLVRYRYEADDEVHIHDMGLIPTLTNLQIKTATSIDSGINSYKYPDGTNVAETTYYHKRTGDTDVSSADLVATYSNSYGDGKDAQVKIGEFSAIEHIWRGDESDPDITGEKNDHLYIRYRYEDDDMGHDMGYIPTQIHNATGDNDETPATGVTLHPQDYSMTDLEYHAEGRKADIHVNYTDGTFELIGTTTSGLAAAWLGTEQDAYMYDDEAEAYTTTLRPAAEAYDTFTGGQGKYYYVNHLLVRYEHEPKSVFHDLGYVKGDRGSYLVIEIPYDLKFSDNTGYYKLKNPINPFKPGDGDLPDASAVGYERSETIAVHLQWLNENYPNGYQDGDGDITKYYGVAIQMGQDMNGKIYFYNWTKAKDTDTKPIGWEYSSAIGFDYNIMKRILVLFPQATDEQIYSGAVIGWDTPGETQVTTFDTLYRNGIGFLFENRDIDTV